MRRSNGASTWLLDRQAPEGWWTGELETNVTMTAEQILLFRFLGIDVAPVAAARSRTSCAISASDGSWALYYEARPT